MSLSSPRESLLCVRSMAFLCMDMGWFVRAGRFPADVGTKLRSVGRVESASRKGEGPD